MSRCRSLPVLLLAALLGAAAMSCSPKIGDECSSSTDCSTNGDRLCDTTQPGGYCTVFNCEPDTCPEEAQCIAFDQQLAPECVDPQTWARFERTFCMLRCDDNSDCRSGYVCFDMGVQSNPWGAALVDRSPEGTKVCISPSTGAPQPDGLTDVCRPYDGGFPDAPSSSPDAADDAPADGQDEATTDVAQPDVAPDVLPDVVPDASPDVSQDAAPQDDAGPDAAPADASPDSLPADAGASDSG